MAPNSGAGGLGCPAREGVNEPRGAAPRKSKKLPRLAFLVVDIVDDLGHVVLVLAELGRILDELLVLFLLALARLGLLALGRLGLLGLGNLGLLDLGRLDFLLLGHGRPRAARLQDGFRIVDGAAFRAGDGVAVQIIERRATAVTDALCTPFGLHHILLLLCRRRRWGAASASPSDACQS